MKPIHLLIVESDPLVLFSISQVIRYFDNYLVVDKVDNAEDALERMRVVPVDLIILGGQENIGKWHIFVESGLKTKLLMLVTNPAKEMVQDAISYGVWDMVIRPISTERLRFSLEMFRYRHIYGESLEYPVQQERLDSIFFPRERHQHIIAGTIKNSEMLEKVLQLIENGDEPQSAGEIAGVLSVSRITVRKYCEALVNTGKLHVKNKYQAKGRPIKQYYMA
ncbi:MAG: HTH domain-containing protein [Synergistaceae bacterium]|jgi:response regulator of citrate/malate metabolism|nr:HTH domain-containing protein [Synergistaceae bacterium]